MKFKVDKVYVITINKSRDNIKKIIDKVHSIGLPNEAPIEVVGVNGWNLADEKYNRIIYKNWNISHENRDLPKWYTRDITKGEVGCSLSHIAIWKDAYSNNYENIIIYEDDVKPTGWDMNWSILDNIDFDLLYLGRSLQYNSEDNWDLYCNEDVCIPGFSYASHAYVLSKSGLEIFVNDYLPIFEHAIFPIDDLLPVAYNAPPIARNDLHDLFDETRIIKALALNKQVCTQEAPEKSSTEPRD